MIALGVSSACSEAPPPPAKVPQPPVASSASAEAPEPPPPNAVRPTVKDNRVELKGQVMFDDDKATLKRESDATLEIVYQYLLENQQVTKLRIEGHTDASPDEARDKTLSMERAMAVAQWLVGKGIDCHRLVPVGFGKTRLKVDPERTAEDKAQNRRVEFVNAQLDGKAIGGLPLDGGGTLAGAPCK
jgi:OmpA-OmpF porin, OOP family